MSISILDRFARFKLCIIFSITLAFSLLTIPVQAQSDVATAVTFSCGDSETTIAAKGGANRTAGNQTIYIGYQQFGNNQNPILASFTNGIQDWCRTDYEVTPDDSAGYGLFWDGTASGLYGVFSVTGTQGDSSQDFRRFATGGWLSSYTDGSPGGGGGPKASIVARINPSNGDISTATFITARLSSGKTNSLSITDLSFQNDVLKVEANSFYSPRNPDKSAMSCSGSSPFVYTLYLSADLSTALAASADRCEGNSTVVPESLMVTPSIGFVGDNTFIASVAPTTAQRPISFTWAINGVVVREVAVDSIIDSFSQNWPAPILSQTLQVTATNQAREMLGQTVLTTTPLIFDVVEAERVYLPLLFKSC